MDYAKSAENYRQSYMVFEERIKAYLERQIQKDEGLKARYDPKYLKNLGEFIWGCASILLKHKNGALEDAMVYKMCRDYFNEGIYLEDEKRREEQRKKEEEAKAKAKANPTTTPSTHTDHVKQYEITKAEQERKKQEEARRKLYTDQNSLFFGMDEEEDGEPELEDEDYILDMPLPEDEAEDEE